MYGMAKKSATPKAVAPRRKPAVLISRLEIRTTPEWHKSVHAAAGTLTQIGRSEFNASDVIREIVSKHLDKFVQDKIKELTK